MMRSRVLIIGPGDLACRLAAELVHCPLVGELVLAGRQSGRGPAIARELSVRGAPVRFAKLDALRLDAVLETLARELPDLIVQCGSLLSPWTLFDRVDPIARAVRTAGFAVQLPAQLPILLNVMRAVRETRSAGASVPVVNCSYPDVTHAMLQRLNLAPVIGAGNVGMIRQQLLGSLQRCGPSHATATVRVLAHHAHVRSVMLCDRAQLGEGPFPQVYMGESGVRADELVYADAPLVADRTLNALSSAHAAMIVRALLSSSEPIRTSAPGPLGLPGGYPVIVSRSRVELDLPATLTLEAAVAFNTHSAALDGVREIRADGTLVFTEAAQARMAALAPELTEPLHPEAALARFEVLARALGLPEVS